MDDVIHIVDYGLGNLGSLTNMFRRIGAKAILSGDVDILKKANKILLPGVGAFDRGIKNLKENKIDALLTEKALVEKIPVLGICLGMQLMAARSDEGEEKGLGWFDAEAVSMKNCLPREGNIKLPHIGWNYVDAVQEHFLLRDMPADLRFYFAHGYMLKCREQTDILAKTYYGSLEIASMIIKDNIAGAQFHPEKSHKFGMQLFRNFSSWMPRS